MNIDMKSDSMRDQYDSYLSNHINNVKKGLDWMIENIPEIFKIDPISLSMIISHHDESKYSDEEYFAYCEYFYGEKTPEVEDEFDLAWLHHQHNNPHHWQHWLLREDDGDMKALEMPEIYIIEMVCDHWAFSWAKNDLYEIFNWYKENKPKMLLHPNTQQRYEEILDKLKTKLDEGNYDKE